MLNRPSNRRCWATSLGDCEGKLSREHLISECFWEGDKVIYVQGMNWCRAEPKAVGLSSLTGRVLCERHNAQLGEHVDPVAATMRKVIEKATLLQNARVKLRARHYNHVSFRVQGKLLERWFLKTLINLSESDTNIRAGERVDRIPAEELVKIAFGLSEWRGESGLWLAVGQPGTQQQIERRLRFSSFTDGETLVGALFSFCGYDLYLNLQTVRPKVPEFNARQTLRHVRRYVYTIPDDKDRQVRSHTIHLDW